MKDTTASKPAILIDLKKKRIRIHKQTLYLLGNPDYISLLVNPDERVIAVCRGSRSDHLSHHINWKAIVNKKSYELYSTNLLHSLRDISIDWQDNQSYRIYGEIIPNQGIAQFRMNDSISMNGV